MKRRIKVMICVLYALAMTVSCTNVDTHGFMYYDKGMTQDEIIDAAVSSGGRVIDDDAPFSYLSVIYDFPADLQADRLTLYMLPFEGELQYIQGSSLYVHNPSEDITPKFNSFVEYFNTLYGSGRHRGSIAYDIEPYWDDNYDWTIKGNSFNIADLLTKTVTVEELLDHDIELTVERIGMRKLTEAEGIDIETLPPDTLITIIIFIII